MGLNPDYVLDHIQTYEIKALFEYGFLKSKEDWEQTRLIGYITAQCQSTKKLKAEDIIKFPWEEKEKKTPQQTEIDKQKLEQVKEMAKQIMKNGLN